MHHEPMRARRAGRKASALVTPAALLLLSLTGLVRAATENPGVPAQPGRPLTLDLGAGVRMEFVWIGALDGWVGKHEVTLEQYLRFRPGHNSERAALATHPSQPVVSVDFAATTNFVGWVKNQCLAQIPEGYRIRLPTGGEWTIFAACGDGREYPWGNTWPPAYGNYDDETACDPDHIAGYRDGHAVPAPVDQSGTNEWGLCGVGGNVWEWTSEGDDIRRALRGGAWDVHDPYYLRLRYRFWQVITNIYVFDGFRLVILRSSPLLR